MTQSHHTTASTALDRRRGAAALDDYNAAGVPGTIASAADTQVPMWPVARLRPNRLNPRGEIDPASVRDLVTSVGEHGVLEPLIVTPEGVVVAGHRRLLAAQLAGRTAVPAIARALSEVQQLEIMLVENVQRAALTPLEEAHGFQRLADRGVTQMDIARRVGVTSAYVKERLVILRLAPAVQALYGRNALPVTLVRVLLEVEDEARQLRLATLAAERGLPVLQIEALVRRGQQLQESGQRQNAATAPPPEPRRLGPDRERAVALLVKNPAQKVSFTRLFGVMDAVCCACGTHEVTPQMCRECPLPRFITLLALPPERLRALARGRTDRTAAGEAA